MVFKWLKKIGRDKSQPRDPAAMNAVAQQVAAAAASARKAEPAPAPPRDIPADKIAQRAYEIWVRKGQPADTADQDWREAEAELRAEYLARPGSDALPNKPR